MKNPVRELPRLQKRSWGSVFRILQVSCIVSVGYNAITMYQSTSDNLYLIQPDLKTDIIFPTGKEYQLHSYRLERNVFKKLIERFGSVIDSCHKIPSSEKEEVVKDFDTGVPPLPEHGLHEALRGWVLKEDGANDNTREYHPMCQLPPTKSCDTTSYSVILMSHTISDQLRLQKMIKGIHTLSKRPSTAEIILVWNAEKEILTNSEDKRAMKLITFDQDSSHPLRIFYSLSNGLKNNLLNRYHPSIQPTEDVVMYFDDDGPFFSEDVMNAGFQLWKLHSDTQVGCMGRNIRFTSKRMQALQVNATTAAVKLHTENAWETHFSPYDTSYSDPAGQSAVGASRYPKFTPICNKETGDMVEYNFNHFPHFMAHMFLPSGTLLHRNFLCFIWHPAFAELRQYILDHPTHPDDIMVSTLVSHLSGRILQTFPRRIRTSKIPDADESQYEQNGPLKVEENRVNQDLVGRDRRKLLWEQESWAEMRGEAMNSILNYFGSINPGSIGWCVGTPYYKERKGRDGMKAFNCEPEFPIIEQIPWMDKNVSASDFCK